ncbi:MAG: hypothetical protein NTX86_01050 [Candidatus Dependentiae bacterium]|nr:hypothetical protein [Candidatus Dependentiae bacterium]
MYQVMRLRMNCCLLGLLLSSGFGHAMNQSSSAAVELSPVTCRNDEQKIDLKGQVELVCTELHKVVQLQKNEATHNLERAILLNDSTWMHALLLQKADVTTHAARNDYLIKLAMDKNRPQCLALLIVAGMEVNLKRLGAVRADYFIRRRECLHVLGAATFDIGNEDTYQEISQEFSGYEMPHDAQDTCCCLIM